MVKKKKKKQCRKPFRRPRKHNDNLCRAFALGSPCFRRVCQTHIQAGLHLAHETCCSSDQHILPLVVLRYGHHDVCPSSPPTCTRQTDIKKKNQINKNSEPRRTQRIERDSEESSTAAQRRNKSSAFQKFSSKMSEAASCGGFQKWSEKKFGNILTLLQI